MRTFLACLFTLFLVGCGVQSSTTIPMPLPATTPTTPVAFNVAGATTVDIEIPSMDCAGCCDSAFAKVDGVLECKFDDQSKVATLAIDEESFDKDAVMAKLQEAYADAQFATASAE